MYFYKQISKHNEQAELLEMRIVPGVTFCTDAFNFIVNYLSTFVNAKP